MSNFKYGCWNIISDQHSVEVLANELDFIFIDLEHGFRDFKDFASAFVATRTTEAEIYVRVRSYRDPWIQSLLDLGVTHFIVPQIRKSSEVEEFLRATTFPPNGRRGLHPRIFQTGGKDASNLIDVLDSKIHVCIIAETRESVTLMEELCSNPRIDEIYLGVYDLSLELGILDGTDSNEMLSICTNLSKIATNFAKPLIAMATSTSILKKFQAMGISKFVIGIDSSILQESVKLKIDSFRKVLDANLA